MEIKEVVIGTTEITEADKATCASSCSNDNDNDKCNIVKNYTLPQRNTFDTHWDKRTISLKDVAERTNQLYKLLYDKTHNNCSHNNSSESKPESGINIIMTTIPSPFPRIHATELTRIAEISELLDQVESWAIEEAHLELSEPSIFAETVLPELIIMCLCCERPAIVAPSLHIVYLWLQQHRKWSSRINAYVCKLLQQHHLIQCDSRTESVTSGKSENSVMHFYQKHINNRCSAIFVFIIQLMSHFGNKTEVQVEAMNILRLVTLEKCASELAHVNREEEEEELNYQQQEEEEEYKEQSSVELESVIEEVQVISLIVQVMCKNNDCAEIQVAAVELLDAISQRCPRFWEEYGNCNFVMETSAPISINKAISIWEVLVHSLLLHWTNLSIKRAIFHFLRNALRSSCGKYYLLHTPLYFANKVEITEVTKVYEKSNNNNNNGNNRNNYNNNDEGVENNLAEYMWDRCVRALPLSAYTLDVFRDVCEIIGHFIPFVSFTKLEELMNVLRNLLLKHGTTEVLTLTLGLLHVIFIKVKQEQQQQQKEEEEQIYNQENKSEKWSVHGAYQLYLQPPMTETRKEDNTISNDTERVITEELTQMAKEVRHSELTKEEHLSSLHNVITNNTRSNEKDVQSCVQCIIRLCIPQLIMHLLQYHQEALISLQETTLERNNHYNNNNNNNNKNNVEDINNCSHEGILRDESLELLCVVAQNCIRALPV